MSPSDGTPEAPTAHPYRDLPTEAYWRSAVADVPALGVRNLFRPRLEVTRETVIASAGSCFAQHLGRQFRQRGYTYLDVEPGPKDADAAVLARFGLGLYSARYGNVYSVRQLLQLFRRASGDFSPVETAWEQAGRWYDPFRPAIEPQGFASLEELECDRRWHLAQVATLLPRTELFVFTFGLTECWEVLADGAILPTCPGTVAGQYDPARYAFRNFGYEDTLADAEAFIALALSANPAMKFLFTVSPVPLTATASGEHVLVATQYSKSVLRAVCGRLTERYSQVDYFPSYELVSSHPQRGQLFEDNLRSVSADGVSYVMGHFFAAHGGAPLPPPGSTTRTDQRHEDDVVCEEAILEAFGR